MYNLINRVMFLFIVPQGCSLCFHKAAESAVKVENVLHIIVGHVWNFLFRVLHIDFCFVFFPPETSATAKTNTICQLSSYVLRNYLGSVLHSASLSQSAICRSDYIIHKFFFNMTNTSSDSFVDNLIIFNTFIPHSFPLTCSQLSRVPKWYCDIYLKVVWL